jgi:hypothetical protein
MSTPLTRSEHHGLPSPLLAPVVLSALPVGVPSSRQSLGAPRRRLLCCFVAASALL